MDVSLTEANPMSPTANGKIEISVRGKWQAVPALEAHGHTIAITGRRIKIAAVHDEEWLVDEVLAPEDYIATLKANARVAPADIFAFSQKIPAVEARFPYAMERESSAVARIGDFKAWWASLPQESRKNVRRSEKRGVTIKRMEFDDELVNGIRDVQNERPIRQGRRYPHFGKSFEQVKKDHSSFLDRCDFLAAYFEGKIIGFLKVVHRGEVSSLLQLNSMVAHFDKRPANALLAKGIELASARGAQYFTYGRFTYGNKGDDSLREFKTRNGFEEMLLPRYYVPLTAWGRFCVKAKLYRGVMEILPGSVIRAIVGARLKWYHLRGRA